MSTLTRVASIAGVSKATVSRVLNDRGNVHRDTVQLVRAAMDAAQYEAPAPRSARPGRAESLGRLTRSLSVYALVVPEIAAGMYVSLLNGFEAAAKDLFRRAIICTTADDVYKQGHEILELIHRRVGGVAIVPVSSGATPLVHIESLQVAGIPVVMLHRGVEGASAPLIALPLEEAGVAAGRALLGQGHRRIAVFTSSEGTSAQSHLRGLRLAMGESDLELDSRWIYHIAGCAPVPIPEVDLVVANALTQWESLPPALRPTGIYATNDTLAEVVYMALMRIGRRVPADVSIVSFGDRERNGAIISRLTSVVVDERSIGRAAIDAIERRADGGLEPVDSRKSVPLSLLDGQTLGPAIQLQSL